VAFCARAGVILRFPRPSEVNTSPKSWRRLSLLDLASRLLLDRNNKRRQQSMATKDSFPPDDRFPVFLSEDGGEIGQPDIGKAWNRAAIASRILKVSIFAAVATAIGIAILLVGNPVSLVADVTAAWTDKSEVQPGADPTTAATPSIATAQDAPPATTDTPTREETAAVSEPAAQTRAEVDQPPSEDMFKQFQAWAAEADARTQAEPVKPAQDFAPVQAMQDAPARVAQEAPAPVQPAKKQRRAKSVHNARAEVRPQRNVRARYREEQSAAVPLAPVPDPRVQEQAVQPPQTPSFLQTFGLR
jgi:hypothetical protein